MKKSVLAVTIVLVLLISACSHQHSTSTTAEVTDTTAHDRTIHGILVKGKVIDNETRCTHYHTNLDIIALKFKCCNTYYPCFTCHEEQAGHPATQWDLSERGEKAVLCGVCGHELSIKEYLACTNVCPNCQSHFNPGCRNHYHLYFKVDSTTMDHVI